MFSELVSLVKPRIVALLCLTGVTASFAAGGLAPPALVAFVVAGVCTAGGAAALNCYYDRDIDREMERTADRPLAREAMAPWVPLAFACLLLAVGTLVGLWGLPAVSVVYMWLGVAAYVGLYTVALKRRHWMGVVLGGSAGSFPVLAGWTAVRPVGLPAVLMAVLVFVWTPAHAWALAVVYRDDFEAVDVPTLPVVASPERVRRYVWTAAVVTVGTALAGTAITGPVYLAALLPAAPLFALSFRRFYRQGGDANAVHAFFTSNLFLAALFVAWGLGGVTDSPVLTVAVSGATLASFAWLWTNRPQLRGVTAASVDEILGQPARRYGPSQLTTLWREHVRE